MLISATAALGLTDNQVTALDNLRKARIVEIQKIKADTGLADLRTALREMYKSPNPNPMEVGQLNLKIRAVEKLMNDARSSYTEASRMLLDETQQKKLRALRKSLKLIRAADQAVAWGLIKEPRKR